MTCIRTTLALIFACTLSSVALSANAATTAVALSPSDAELYSTAFTAAEKGDFATADESLAHVSDPCLVGRVQYLKITHPARHGVSYGELVGWLKAFKDLPGADRIYALAMRLKPAGAEPPAPAATAVVATAADGARPHPSPQSHAAREAFFDGDLKRALHLAKASGDAWIAGMAAYRLNAYVDAGQSFAAVARNPGEPDAIRAAGAFWAARSAETLGSADSAQAYLRIAAALPDTFYGMIAERRLALSDDPLGRVLETALPAATDPAPITPRKIDAAGFDSPGVIRLIQTDPRARRAVALAQIGRAQDAGLELRTGLAQAGSNDERDAWTTLVLALNPNRSAGATVVSAPPASTHGVLYPTPALSPQGGFQIDKALVYALVWQESRFDSLAVSPAGAIGLMQLMPASASQMAGDDIYKSDPVPLFDPGSNLAIGQTYVRWLMDHGADGDLMRAVAAYNGGPATLTRTEQLVGPDADTLLLVESLPFAETRGYVHKVMAAYWSYRRQFGEASPTLDAAASGAHLIEARLDR